MAEESPLSATGTLTEAQYEALAAPQCPDGLIGWPGTLSVAQIFGGQIAIKAGNRGIIRGFPWASGPVDTYLNPVLTGAARTDLVVLRLFRDQSYKVGTALRQGTPGAGPPAPYVATGLADWYEIPLATYDVAGGALSNLRTVAWYIGDDGQILCWSDRRPPHQSGRRIREVDTGRTYESNGTQWVVLLDDAGDGSLPFLTTTGGATGFAAPTLNWLTRINGQGRLSITAQRTGANIASGANVVLGTLPAGFRPRRYFESTARAGLATNLTASFDVNGEIRLRFLDGGLSTGGFLLIPPVTWPVAA